MINQEWLDALQDDDPEMRKEAVIHVTGVGTPEAMRHLAKVYRNDPDPEVRELAREGGVMLREQGVTMRGDEPPAQSRPAQPSPQPARQSSSGGGGSVFHTPHGMKWQDVVPDLLLYLVIMTVGVFITLLAFTQVFESFFTELYASEPQIFESETLFTTDSSFALILAALISGIGLTVGLVVQTFIIHYLAAGTFGGSGNMYGFMRKYAIANAVYTAVLLGIFMFMFVNTFNALDPDTFLTTTSDPTMTQPMDAGLANMICGLMCLGLFILFGGFFYFGRLIGSHYNVGTFQGVVAFVAGAIAVQILSGIFSNFVGALVSPFV